MRFPVLFVIFVCVLGQGFREDTLAWETLIRIGIARMEAGAGERWPVGMGSTECGSNGVWQ